MINAISSILFSQENKENIRFSIYNEKEENINIDTINKIILDTNDQNIEDSIRDNSLIEKYYKHPKVIENRKKWIEIFAPYIYRDSLEDILYNPDIVLEFLPKNKDIIKKEMFDKEVKDILVKFFSSEKYNLQFNEKFDETELETPDWFVQDNYNGKVVIGFNQINIDKEINPNREIAHIVNIKQDNIKYLSVICDRKIIYSEDDRNLKYIKKGLTSQSLCYIKMLPFIVSAHLY